MYPESVSVTYAVVCSIYKITHLYIYRYMFLKKKGPIILVNNIYEGRQAIQCRDATRVSSIIYLGYHQDLPVMAFMATEIRLLFQFLEPSEQP